MADTAPAILWVTGTDASCVYLSQGWYEYTGQQPENALGFGWLEAIHPDDRDQAGSVFLDANARKQPFSLDYRLRRADGEYRWAIDAGRPRFADDGPFLGYVGSVIDIHERKQAEQELRTSELWFRQIAGNVDAAFTVHDLVNRKIVYASPAFERLWGVPTEAFLADRGMWMRIVHPDDHDRIERGIRAMYDGGEPFDAEYRIVLPDGERWVRGRATIATRDAQGRPLIATGLVEDITDRKTHERQLRVVMNELNHRVKNTLAVVQAIAQQSAGRNATSPDLLAFLDRFGGRLRALAAAHGLLTQSDWSGASIGALVRSELAMRDVLGDRWQVDGPAITLGPKAALAVHMIVHELATNASKHGALADDGGRLEVAWRRQPDTEGTIELSW
ncbi:MAG: sensor histidine kinase, partial [Phycisphaerales bacterium JB064]